MNEIAVTAARVSRFGGRTRSSVLAVLPGLLLTAGMAGLAFELRRLPGLTMLSPMILATLIGMTLQNVFGTPAWAKPGVTFSLKWVLRLGVILLGLQLMASQVVQVGLAGVGAKLAELIGAGTSTCGASAVIATNTVTRGSDEDVA